MGEASPRLAQEVLAALQGAGGPLTPVELSAQLGQDPDTIHEVLFGELLPKGLVQRDRRWRFQPAEFAPSPAAKAEEDDEELGDDSLECWACSSCVAGELEGLPDAAPSQAAPVSPGARRKMEEVIAYDPRASERAQQLADELASCGIEVQQMLQWAAELEAERQAQEASLDEAGRLADVWVLCDLAGEVVHAQVVNGQSTACWELLDPQGRPLGRYVPYRPQAAEVLETAGYQEVCMRMPAKAMIIFGRTGAVWPRVELVVDPQYLPVED